MYLVAETNQRWHTTDNANPFRQKREKEREEKLCYEFIIIQSNDDLLDIDHKLLVNSEQIHDYVNLTKQRDSTFPVALTIQSPNNFTWTSSVAENGQAN